MGNSVPIKMSYPDEFDLSGDCLGRLVGERSLKNGNEYGGYINIHQSLLHSGFFLIRVLCLLYLLLPKKTQQPVP